MPCTARAPSSEGHTRAHGHPPDAAPHLSRRTWYHCMEPNDPPMSSSHTDSICANPPPAPMPARLSTKCRGTERESNTAPIT